MQFLAQFDDTLGRRHRFQLRVRWCARVRIGVRVDLHSVCYVVFVVVPAILVLIIIRGGLFAFTLRFCCCSLLLKLNDGLVVGGVKLREIRN